MKTVDEHIAANGRRNYQTYFFGSQNLNIVRNLNLVWSLVFSWQYISKYWIGIGNELCKR